MVKGQAPGVEGLTLEWDRAKLVGAEGVTHLSNERVAPEARLNADLIPLARCESNLDQAGGLERLDHAVLANRFGGARIFRMRFLLNQRLSVPRQIVAPRP